MVDADVAGGGPGEIMRKIRTLPRGKSADYNRDSLRNVPQGNPLDPQGVSVMTARDLLTMRLEKLQDDFRIHSEELNALQSQVVYRQDQLAMHKGAILVLTELIAQLPDDEAPAAGPETQAAT